jgi:hypothetical protein
MKFLCVAWNFEKHKNSKWWLNIRCQWKLFLLSTLLLNSREFIFIRMYQDQKFTFPNFSYCESCASIHFIHTFAWVVKVIDVFRNKKTIKKNLPSISKNTSNNEKHILTVSWGNDKAFVHKCKYFVSFWSRIN